MRNYDDVDLWGAQLRANNLHKLATLIKDSVPEPWEASIDDILLISKWYYEWHGAGGWLHIVLDDCNLEDSSVDYCINRADSEGDIVCWMLALLIRTMTEPNRQVLYNRLHGYPDNWEPC